MLSEPPPPTFFLLPMDRLDACARLHAGQLVKRVSLYPYVSPVGSITARYRACL